MAMVQPKSQKLRLGDAFRAADFYCGDHVPAADGHRHLPAFG